MKSLRQCAADISQLYDFILNIFCKRAITCLQYQIRWSLNVFCLFQIHKIIHQIQMLNKILKSLVLVSILLLGLNLYTLHGNKILHERLSQCTTNHTVLGQSL